MEKALTLFDSAIIFATKAHSGMTRKGTNVPYIVHPIEAAAIVSAMTDDEEVIAAAVLHDVLEDTAATEDDLLARFGRRITELVIGESEDKRRNFPAALTWKIRKQETITFLETEADTDAKMLALADKLSNLRAIHRDVCIIGDAVWERFNVKDKSMHGWMYRSIARALRELKEHPTWQEYNHLVEVVFGDVSL
ncbi:MAG: bifunctional (p)ppGpp synthetase/guanosine-3',5'-bis(diphosphate) 3'-pyrophosphohydrolase [Lachnospiraceae bacterium]|nr:bifunctional (p)ppGpp synthetase/guanosine-3',5'-bis(diphosphate) 3'-pyrophosphohydrolase [Lachnospiraceae bacterium]MCI9383220.1 bifunctional (p)ppGpp synthetase/guanosine-3',5'-bis(diphosphate) 3'-pyrophosphohydrolase [Lachnospiraceae bacterium]MCI9479220.1 bifunctional (p)ppGpp synthetase/guanosine-3',5'-bis(diphosphate) 3'-pyrophosphohydrolase [Lachnospiraceae bacterium]MCI9623796.1 bifunctional (p)ppGpp synthetase/guanosine-3',5'-bis(diphosphate) 3'-pyrophosphohydrolase [Lachnospiraceae 